MTKSKPKTSAGRVNKVINVSSVPQRSPFRYPGGKTWLVPYIRQWLGSKAAPVKKLVEAFAGGGIVGLTAGFEKLAEAVVMVERDPQIACVWQTVLNGKATWIAERFGTFEPTLKTVEALFQTQWPTTHERAFATLVRNRVARGGILAPGAGLIKSGENGKGLKSRWYPKTLARRIRAISRRKRFFTFIEGDGFDIIRENAADANVAYFIDPPYTHAAKRLYTFGEIDHEALFTLVATVKGDFLMTYDDTAEVRKLATRFGFTVKGVPMKSNHHQEKQELLIGRNLNWLKPLPDNASLTATPSRTQNAAIQPVVHRLNLPQRVLA
jgi:DNA adenine methylase